MTDGILETARARIVCLCDDRDARAELSAAFETAGYVLLPFDDAGRRGADLGIVDLRGRSLSSKKALSIAHLLRRGSPDCRLLFITDEDIDKPGRDALRRHGELIACTLDDAAPAVERCRQMIRLRNIAEETGERLKSLAALNRLTAFPAIAAPSSPPHILIAGAPGAAALSVVNALNGSVEQCVSVFSPGQAMRALDHNDFDCLIVLPKDENDPLLTVARSLRQDPKHCALAVIGVADGVDAAASLTRKGAVETILTAHIGEDVAAKVQLAARRARLLKSMGAFLNACDGDGVRDAASGAFTASFLAEHGARLCARADQTGRPLSAIALRLEADMEDGDREEPGPRALHRSARLINRITRAEDTAARIAPATFLVLTPATHAEDAKNAALRIEGVLENTMFRSTRDDSLFAVRAQTAVCARPEGLCIEEFVALAFSALREQERPAVRRSRWRFPL